MSKLKKATYRASSDVAFIKYWGKKDEVLRLPENGSVSMILAGLDTITTVEFQPQLRADQVVIQAEAEAEEVSRVVKHLDRIRQLAGIEWKARVESQNTFPKGTGLSSSAAGFAALTWAAATAAAHPLSQRELSILARQGSGSACRCICGGFVEWHDGNTSATSFAETIFPANHWDLRDVVAVVDEGKKSISSTQGHQAAHSSPFYQARLTQIGAKITAVKTALAERNFTVLGTIIESEALEFHSILLTSQPPLLAWYPGTIQVMQAVQQLRQEGVEAYFTINTGFNVHVITLPKYVNQVEACLQQLSLVQKTITARVGEGPVELSEHLF